VKFERSFFSFSCIYLDFSSCFSSRFPGREILRKSTQCNISRDERAEMGKRYALIIQFISSSNISSLLDSMSSSSSRQNGANQPPRRSVLQVEEAKRRVEERRQSEDPWEYVFQEEKLRAPSAEIRRVPMVPMVTVDNDGNVIEEPAVEEFIVHSHHRNHGYSTNLSGRCA
jgi:hypothetical protein